MIYYCSVYSVKLRFLIDLTYKTRIIRNRKLIVFANWSVMQWNTEWFLHLLSFQILSIRARHKAADREAVVKAFNDAINPSPNPHHVAAHFDHDSQSPRGRNGERVDWASDFLIIEIQVPISGLRRKPFFVDEVIVSQSRGSSQPCQEERS